MSGVCKRTARTVVLATESVTACSAAVADTCTHRATASTGRCTQRPDFCSRAHVQQPVCLLCLHAALSRGVAGGTGPGGRDGSLLPGLASWEVGRQGPWSQALRPFSRQASGRPCPPEVGAGRGANVRGALGGQRAEPCVALKAELPWRPGPRCWPGPRVQSDLGTFPPPGPRAPRCEMAVTPPFPARDTARLAWGSQGAAIPVRCWRTSTVWLTETRLSK